MPSITRLRRAARRRGFGTARKTEGFCLPSFDRTVNRLFSVRAIASAPNPGYAVATVSVQAAVVTLGGIVLLGASFSWMKTLGVVLCCAGIALLVS